MDGSALAGGGLLEEQPSRGKDGGLEMSRINRRNPGTGGALMDGGHCRMRDGCISPQGRDRHGHANSWCRRSAIIVVLLGITGAVAIAARTPIVADASVPTPFAYVTNKSSSSVSVINASTNTEVATVAVGTVPKGIAVTPNGALAYVVNGGSESVSVIDTATDTVAATVPIPGPEGVAITPDGAFAYVPYFDEGTGARVAVIDTSTNAVVATVKLPPEGGSPGGIAITPDGKFAYVADASQVAVIDTETNTLVTSVTVFNSANVAITPDGAYAYVTGPIAESVSVISTASNTVVATVPLGGSPWQVAITPNGALAYVTVPVAHSVRVISMATNTVVGSVEEGVGEYPRASHLPLMERLPMCRSSVIQACQHFQSSTPRATLSSPTYPPSPQVALKLRSRRRSWVLKRPSRSRSARRSRRGSSRRPHRSSQPLNPNSKRCLPP